MKIVVMGIGFLGAKIFNFFSKEHEVVGAEINPKIFSIKKVDANDKEDLRKFLLNQNPDVVIDTIALTSSVACERNPELCRKINYETAKNIAEICQEIGAKMVFISSSYVFDGKKGDYGELDEPTPTNEYAKTKVLAEKVVLNLPNSIVIRIEPLYGYDETISQIKFGTGIFEKEIKVGKTILIRKPTFVEDVPKVISTLIAKNSSGIFHIAGPDKFGWLEFLRKLASITNQESKIKVVDDSQWIVKSPRDTTLNTAKLNALRIKMTSFENAIKELQKFLYH